MAEENPFAGLGPSVEKQSDNNPFSGLGPASITKESTPLEEEKEQGFLDDTIIGETIEGVLSGGTKLVEGVAGLGAAAVDLTTGTNYADKVAETGEAVRDSMGLDPKGFMGKGAEIVTQFVALPLKVASTAGRFYLGLRAKRMGDAAAKATPLTRSERFAKAGSQIGAAGLAEVAVTNDGVTTIADWVEMGPTQTSDLIGLSGQEKALARFGNRFKSAFEAGALGTAVGSLLGAFGKTPLAQGFAKSASERLGKAGERIDNLLMQRATAQPGTSEELGKFGRFAADAIAFARYRSFLPSDVATKRLLIEGQISRQIKRAEKVVNDFDKELKTAINKLEPGSQLDRVGIMTKVEDFLTETDINTKNSIKRQLPKNIQVHVQSMRDHIDELSNDILESGFLKKNNFVTESGQNISDVIHDGINSYLRRRYRAFEDAKYVPTKESIDSAKSFFRSNREATEKELTRMSKQDVFNETFTDDFISRNGLIREGTGKAATIKVGAKVTDEIATKAQEGFLAQYTVKARESLGGGRVARDLLDAGMFASKKSVPKALRALLGEIDDPREAYLGTVADLSQFNAVDDYFGMISKSADVNPAVSKLFVKPERLNKQQQEGLISRGYVKLGSDSAPSTVSAKGRDMTEAEALMSSQGWGSLTGYYVPQAIYKDLTNAVLAEDSFGSFITRNVVGTFLKAKGISQYSKTVLSPITQVRNFTTAISFAIANGNIPIIGRGGSLADSTKLVFSNITSRGSDDVFADLADAQSRGVLGTNAELREIQDTLNKGMDVSARGPRNFFESVFGENLGKKLQKTSKPLEDLYQGSDDFWKYFNYHAEQAKLRNALSKATDKQKTAYLTKGQGVVDETLKGDELMEELIKRRASQIVRDTVPNYSKAASQLVRFGRRLPVGNFITFPAEIYRTSFNIVRQALDDMASEIPEIQARGRQRMVGFLTVTAVAPAAVKDLASTIVDVPPEVMEAYKRSFGAPWEKGAILVPVGRDGKKLQYINYSTSNPYDSMFRFANRALNESDKAVSEGQNVDRIVYNTMIGTMGEFFAPFFDEAMLTESLLDISVRGGRTKTGAQVYNSQDPEGTKIFKMFAHVADTLMPNLVPFNVSGGEFEPSRFARGVIGSQFPDIIDPKDKLGRERTLTSEIFRQFSGVSPLDFDPVKNLGFTARRLQRSQADSKGIFNRRTDDANATGESLYRAFVQANEAKLRVDRQYYQMIKDLETIGLSKSEIRKILKREKIGGVDGILRGKFEPFKVSNDNLRKMRDAGIISDYRATKGQFLGLRRTMRNISLEEPRETKTVPTSNIKTRDDVYISAPTSVSSNPFANISAPVSTPKPVTPKQVQQKERTILGTASNPFSALKDLEVFQSTRD